MKRPDPATWLVFCIAIAVALIWAAYSQQVWEDYLITYRASKNLAEGHGLVFTPGERVHSYTSPLGVLLPAAAYLATGRTSDTAALWIFRLLSIAAFASAVALMWRLSRRLCASVAPAVLLVALLATDSKTVSFTINGMETGMLLLFAAWAIGLLLTRHPRPALQLGLAWGGMMWTRPDACIYIAAMSAGALLFAPGPESTGWRGRLWWCRSLVAAGGICAAVYLPWFLWATWYYGSPVPHTITAKGLFNHPTVASLLVSVGDFPSIVAAAQSTLRWTFAPAYGMPQDWPALVPALTHLIAFLPTFVCLLPFARWEARLASFVYLAGHCYLTCVVGSPGPWYLPLVAWFGLLTLTLCFGQGLSLAQRLHQAVSPVSSARALRRSLSVAAIGLVLGSAALSVAMCRQAHVEMRISEGLVRRPIGEWLRAHALSPHDSVFLEPLGFIGYYSGLKMLDYPGLGSPEVVAARQRAKNRSFLESWPELVRDLQPDWIVLRPPEERYFAQHDLLLLRETYRLVQQFDASPALANAGWVPIRSFVEFNTRFSIYRRWSAERDRPKGSLRPFFQPTLADFTRKEALAPVELTTEGRLSAHAPSTLVLPRPAGASALAGRFAIADGAYNEAPPTGTDGAEFRIETVDAGGVRTILLRRLLEPYANKLDRGLQDFEVALPAEARSIEFIVTTGPLHRANFDWAYWEQLTFSTAGAPAP